MDSHKKVYWDTVVWIAWLRKEKRKDRETEGIRESMRLIQSGKQQLLVSMSTRWELRQYRMGEVVIKAFADFVDSCRNVTFVGEDLALGDIRDEIMQYYNIDHKIGVKLMGDYDAQHLAYAVLHRVDAFYTFDAGQKKDPKTGKRGINILALGGMVADKYPLHICKPPPPAQTEIQFNDEEE